MSGHLPSPLSGFSLKRIRLLPAPWGRPFQYNNCFDSSAKFGGALDGMTKLAENVLQSLDQCVQRGHPVLSTERGSLYLSNDVPAACIVLKIPIRAYVEFLIGLPDSVRPYGYEVVVIADRPFQIALFSLGGLSMENGLMRLGQRIVTVV